MPVFVTNSWIEVHDQLGTAEDRYKPSKQIRFKTSILRSDLCDYSDAYIVFKGEVTTMLTMIFLMTFFLVIFFLMEALFKKVILLELLLKQLLFMMQIIMIQEILSRVFL